MPLLEAVANGHKVVVFFNFIAGIEELSERLDQIRRGKQPFAVTNDAGAQFGMRSHFLPDLSPCGAW